MNKEDLKALVGRAKQIGIASYGQAGEKHFQHVQIDEDGEIIVYFEYYSCGDYEYETVYLTEQDMTDPIDEVIERRKKEKQEQEERQERKRLDDLRRAQEAQDSREKSEYERLKQKFG